MMLLSGNILLLFPTKCYSTSISAYYHQYSEIYFKSSNLGKHVNLDDALNIISTVSDVSNLSVYVPVRNPTTRLLSIFNSHSKEEFCHTDISSEGYDIETYFNDKFDLLGYDRLGYESYYADGLNVNLFDPDKMLFEMLSEINSIIGISDCPDWIQNLNASPKSNLSVEPAVTDSLLEKFYPLSLDIYNRIRT